MNSAVTRRLTFANRWFMLGFDEFSALLKAAGVESESFDSRVGWPSRRRTI